MTYRFPIRVGDRVAIAPHHDLWMAGCRFGTVTDVNAYREEPGRAYSIDLDTGRNVTLSHDDLLGAVGDTPKSEVDDEHLHHLVTKARRKLKVWGLEPTPILVRDALLDEGPPADPTNLAVYRALVDEGVEEPLGSPVVRHAIKAVLTSLLSEDGENPEYDRALVEAGRDMGVTIEARVNYQGLIDDLAEHIPYCATCAHEDLDPPLGWCPRHMAPALDALIKGS